MEGAITTGEYLNGDMIAAAMLLTLIDLPEVAWAPTSVAYQRGMTGQLGPDQSKAAAGKRFIVLPVLSVDEYTNHWMVAIVDKRENRAFWFNSLPSWPQTCDQKSLVEYLTSQKMVLPGLTVVNVAVTPQPGGWECRLLVAEHVRCFFREPSIKDAAGVHDWAQSAQHHDTLPVVGKPTTPEQKLDWIVMFWAGWWLTMAVVNRQPGAVWWQAQPPRACISTFY